MATRDNAYTGFVVYALTAHSVTLADASLKLFDAGLWVEATALVRQVVETAWTAVWVEAFGTTAARALVHEQTRNARNTMNTFLSAGLESGQVHPEALTRTLDELDRAASPPGRTFEARCADLQGGDRVYAVYRGLSQYCHASTIVVDLYVHAVEKTPTTPDGLVVSVQPRAGDFEFWFDIVPVMLLHARLAWVRLDRTRADRTRLKELARSFGVGARPVKTAVGLRRERERERAWKAKRTGR